MKINIVLLLSISLIWGSQFVVVEQAVQNFYPSIILFYRTVIGFICLYCLCKIQKIQPLQVKSSNQYGSIALLEVTLPMLCIAQGQQYISSSLTSVVMGSVPLFVFLFLLIGQGLRSRSMYEIGCVLIGFSGLWVLFSPSITTTLNFEFMLGSGLILVSAMTFAGSLILMGSLKKEHTLIVTRNILGHGALHAFVIILYMSWQEGFQFLSNILHPTVGLVMLGVISTGIVYFLYISLVERAGSLYASFANYFIPTIGVLSSTFFADENVTYTTWGALALMTLSVALYQLRQHWLQRVSI